MDDIFNTKSASEDYIASYRIITELASSTSSRIFLAQHDSSNQSPVVVKLFYSTSIDTPGETARFLAEIRTLRQLEHPSILPIQDAGVDKGTPYTIIPYLTSGSLYERMKHDVTRPLPIEDALNILFQIGQALHYAHQRHVFHGNLKPRNILFNENAQVQVADFTCTAVHKTVNGSSLINPDAAFYMSPEQFTHAPDALSDQYMLGCLAYELFTTHKPFKPSFSTQQQREDPLPPTQLNPHLPLQIEHAILKALATEPGQRHSDVLAFINAMSVSLPAAKTTIPVLPPSSQALAQQETSHLVPISALSSPPNQDIGPVLRSSIQGRSRRRKLLLLVSCIAAIIVLGGLLSSSFLFARTSSNTASLGTSTGNTPTTSIQSGAATRSPSDSTGKMSPPTTPTQANISPTQSIKLSTPTLAVSKRAATPHPGVLLNPLQVSPTSFTTANCVVDNSNYRCTAELHLSNQSQEQLNWQVVTTGISAKFNSTTGTISPGQTEQLIIYIHDACPQSGSLIFSGAGNTTKATWNC